MRTNLTRKTLISFVVLLSPVFLAYSQPVSAAGLVPCGLGASDPCTLCHLFVLIKNILDFGMGIIVTVSLLGIAIGGVMYVVSAGTPAMMTKAKSVITNVVIGFALMLGAWLLVYTTLTVLAIKSDMGIGKTAWNSFDCSTVSSSTTIGPGGDIPTAPPVNCGAFNFQPGIVDQCNEVSPELQSLMNCLAEKLGKENFEISSISDRNEGAHCWNVYHVQCTSDAQSNCCHHKETSCHYGGTNPVCKGFSHAIDISNKSSATSNEIQAATTACGGKAIPEGTHVHVSIPGACGCDGLHFAD